MFGSKKIIFSLSVILSLGLILPLCFHAGMAEASPSRHHHEMQAHGEHNQQSNEEQCSCGHEIAKVYQKTKKAVNAQLISSLPVAVALTAKKKLLISRFQSLSIQNYRYFISDSSPPLHLLLGVFLN